MSECRVNDDNELVNDENVTAKPLGLESKSLPDDRITASSVANAPPTPPSNARLNNSVAWCAGDSYDCWLQVDLGGTHRVTSVATQGNPKGNNDYVKKYRLQYSLDDESWVTHEENGNQIIDANEDHNSVKTVSLQQPIVGQFVRFCPVDWYFCPSLRVELYGVPEEDKRSKDDEHETIVMKTEKLVQTDEQGERRIKESGIKEDVDRIKDDDRETIVMKTEKQVETDEQGERSIKGSGIKEDVDRIKDDDRETIVMKTEKLVQTDEQGERRIKESGIKEDVDRIKDDDRETTVIKTEKQVQTEVTDEDEKYQKQTGRHSETQKIVFIHLIHQMTEKKSPSLEECSIHSEDAQPLHPPLCAIREDDIHRLMDWETEGTRGWKRLKRSRDCEVWSRRSQEGGPPITKAIVKLGGVPYDEAVKLLQDWETRRHWDKTFDRIDVLGKFDDPSSLLIHCPIKKHEFGLEILDKDDKNEPYFASAWRNATHPKTQHEKPKPLKLDYLFAGLVVRPQSVDNNSLLVTIICQVKGSVPSQAKGTFLVADPAKWAASLKKFHAQKLKMKAPVTNNSQQHSCCRFFRT
ncbi:uncharacterized protein LOC116621138 [Nematostella vectensis]|uniref:uncharacterized protein LOC116621138 n=1 Tax=Nematostella vectensis TaxID=45351 RepID=UPI0020775DE4|nr:uncharacterized protein LOC116621138 [Nematostella vectensis]